MDKPRVRLLTGVLLAAGLLAGCAQQQKKGELELAQLVTMLPGSYDNIAQARADTAGAAQPGGTREALRLVIVPVYAPTIGDHVFYSQEMAAQDPRRVTAQRLMSFDLGPDATLLPQDVKTQAGCQLVWTKTDKGFAGHNDKRLCRATSRATGETLHVETRFELDADRLAILDRQYDAAGRAVIGLQSDPWYRFERRAD